MKRVEHGDDIFNGRTRLNIVDGIKDKTAARRENFAALQYFFADFSGRTKRKRLLSVNAAAPKSDAVAKALFEFLSIHVGRGALHRVVDVKPAFDEVV